MRVRASLRQYRFIYEGITTLTLDIESLGHTFGYTRATLTDYHVWKRDALGFDSRPTVAALPQDIHTGPATPKYSTRVAE